MEYWGSLAVHNSARGANNIACIAMTPCQSPAEGVATIASDFYVYVAATISPRSMLTSERLAYALVAHAHAKQGEQWAQLPDRL